MNRILTIIVVAILALVPQLSATPEFWITQLNYIGLDSLVVLGLLLLTGVGGLTSFGQAAFVGIGAYSKAWLNNAMGSSPWAALVVGPFLTFIVAYVLGSLTIKRKSVV